MMIRNQNLVIFIGTSLLVAACAQSQGLRKEHHHEKVLVRLVTCPGPLPKIPECAHSKITPLTVNVWMIEGGSACFQNLPIECAVEKNQKQAIFNIPLKNQASPTPGKLITPKK
jgi:hypothetical protein